MPNETLRTFLRDVARSFAPQWWVYMYVGRALRLRAGGSDLDTLRLIKTINRTLDQEPESEPTS